MLQTILKMKSDFSMAAILNGAGKSEKCGKVCKDVALRLSLEDGDLWRSFHRMTNEMIVTKNGRYVRGSSLYYYVILAYVCESIYKYCKCDSDFRIAFVHFYSEAYINKEVNGEQIPSCLYFAIICLILLRHHDKRMF